MKQAVRMPWGALRPAKEPFIHHGELVEVDERGRVLGPVKVGPKKTAQRKAARKKAALPPPVDNSDLGSLNELDNI